MPRDWLKVEHPIYTARKEEWETNERRLRGGVGVREELVPFDWETRPPTSDDMIAPKIQGAGEHYRMRQGMAVYLNFPEMFTGAMAGQLLRKRPSADAGLSFGALGTVSRTTGDPKPSRAELVYYNVDGIGSGGSHWDAWWDAVIQMAMATGHRWLFCEAPELPAATLEDEIRGRRPFLAHYSPLQVINWGDDAGRLDFAIVRFHYRRPRIGAGGTLEGNTPETGYRLMVRAGWQGLGTEYAGGGWWEYDADGHPLRVQDQERRGTWEKTGGEIPLWPHFYERDPDQFSRSGLTEIGAAAAAYMNLDSAATFDVWDAAQSITWLMGVAPEAYQIAVNKLREGSKLVPVPPSMDGTQQPQIVDSAQGAVTAGVITDRLDAIRSSVRELSVQEATSVPASSGFSKSMGFAEKRAPKLALMAAEIQASQSTALHFLEQRFGVARPTGSVTWPTEFDLEPVVERIDRYLAAETRTGYRSPTIGSRAMLRLAKDAGLHTDDSEEGRVQQEYVDAVAGVIRDEVGTDPLLRRLTVSPDPDITDE